MDILKFRVRGQALILTNPNVNLIPVTDTVNQYLCQFDFSEDWDDLNKVVVFKNVSYNISKEVYLSTSNECYIPWEVLSNAGEIFLEVIGTEVRGEVVTVRIPSTLLCFKWEIQEGLLDVSANISPTPDLFEQFVSSVREDSIVAATARDEAVIARDVAAQSAADASASELAATSAAESAVNSASTASSAASSASESALSVAGVADETKSYAEIASAKAADASTQAEIAAGAKEDAVTAKNGAEAARDAAVTAKNDAEAARDVTLSAKEIFDNNAETKLTTYNQNASEKISSYNSNATEKLNAYNANANNRVAEFDSHTEQIQTDIGELKSDISNHLNGMVYNDISFSVVQGAYVDNKTGAFVIYEGWDRTDYIEVDATIDLYIESAGKMNFCAVYDENKTFVSNLIISTGFNYLYIRGDVKYIALSTTTGNLAKVKIWNTDMHKVNGSVNKETDFSNNLINVPWRIGSLDSNGAYNHTWYRLVSDYIELPYKGAEHAIEYNSTWVISIAEYDENKEFIYISSYISDDTIRVFSPNTKFIRMIAYNSVDENYVKVGDIWSSGISVKVTGLPNKLKVMSYNLGHYAYGTGMGLPANIYDEKLMNYRKFIGKELPDVCGFQEYDSRMDEENTVWATDALWSHYYPHSYNTGTQTALFAKERISWGGTKQLSTGRYYTEGTMNGIYLISVHPSLGADKANVRITECNEIINIVKQYERYIIFGDFNCEPNEEDSLFKLFTDEGTNIANCGWFGKFYTWSSNSGDFNNYENPTGTLWYIDNIITSSNINIINAYPVPDAYSLLSSDHIPIIAELEIN